MKRTRSDTLTGGTGDVSPQLMTLTATQTAADTVTSVQFPIPVQRLPTGTKAQVMEVLKVFASVRGAGIEVDNRVFLTLTTRDFGTTQANLSDPNVFFLYKREILITTSGQIINYEPYLMDLTDNAGHGILIATDKIYLQVGSVTTGTAVTGDIKILYRWKNVALSEYIGIVQAQTSG